jgi:HAD superfamily hydrolase (TIGR01509 family)
VSRYDAVVFDLDGTLIDTEALCNAAGQEACRRLGLALPPGFFETLAGIDDATRARMLGEAAGRAVDLSEFLRIWDGLCTEVFARGMPVKPGAHDLLGRLAGEGVVLGLATSSRRGPANEKLAGAGLGGFFRTVVTFEDVRAPKPAPDPYLLAAERLGVRPKRCLAFEDSETGARAARAAGFRVVQVPDLHPTRGEHAHWVAANLWAGAVAAKLVAAAPVG